MNRRDLIQRVLVGGAVLVMAPSVLQSCTKDPTTDPSMNPSNNPGGGNNGSGIMVDLSLASNDILNTTGGSKVVQNVLIINIGGGNFSALSSICTHQGCTVGFNSGSGNVECPCHGSAFTTSGSVVNGPASSPLHAYTVTKTGNTLNVVA